MELIKANVELYVEHDPVLKIERMARVCTNSEDKIKEGSAESLVKKCLNSKHFNICGGYHITVKFYDITPSNMMILETVNAYLEPNITNKTMSGNIQAWRDFLVAAKDLIKPHPDVMGYIIKSIGYALNKFSPIFFEDLISDENDWRIHENDVLCKAYEADNYMTLKWTTDRGISHEAVRSRVMSFMQSSTRYINYNKKGIKFIIPEPFQWAVDKTGVYRDWLMYMTTCEKTYISMLNAGCSPQEARTVLPNSLATELFITGTFKQWDHLISIRDTSHAHPQIRLLMPDTKHFLRMMRYGES